MTDAAGRDEDPQAVARSAAFCLGLGLAQGTALYLLYRGYQANAWLFDEGWLFNALVVTALYVPLVAYWGLQAMSPRRYAGLLLVSASVCIGLGAYQGATVFPVPATAPAPLADAEMFPAIAILMFISVPMVAGWRAWAFAPRTFGWDYPRLFELAWRNAINSQQALALTGLFWALLLLGAQLFALIGVHWIEDMVAERWFSVPATTFTFALAYRGGLQRAGFALTLRRHWLTLTSWLLPLASLIGTAFVVTALFGVDKLFESGISGWLLLWFAAFWITFFNSVYQDGAVPDELPPWLLALLPTSALALAGIVGFAAWALTLRIDQYGLTTERIWGALTVAVAAVYGLGYALGALLTRPGRWMPTLGATNLVATLMMGFGIFALLSPLLDADRLAALEQIRRLETQVIAEDAFDVEALTRLGRAGHSALQRLSEQKVANAANLSGRARRALERTRADPDALVEDFASRLQVFPADAIVPASFLTHLRHDVKERPAWERSNSCFLRDATVPRCRVLAVDLDVDGVDEIAIWMSREGAAEVYAPRNERWTRIGTLTARAIRSEALDAALVAGRLSVVPPRWQDLKVGEFRLRLLPGDIQ